MTKQNLLEELYSDSGPFDISATIAQIKPFVRFQRETNKIYLTDAGIEVSVDQKALLYGIGKKLLKSQILIDQESFSAKEVSDELGIKKGTIDPVFQTLRKKGLILGKKSNYTIPNDKVNKIFNLLNERSEHGKRT